MIISLKEAPSSPCMLYLLMSVRNWNFRTAGGGSNAFPYKTCLLHDLDLDSS